MPPAPWSPAGPLPLPPVCGVTHRTVDVGGLPVHVAEAGEGPPLVLRHGWPRHWYAWRRLVPLLAPTRRLVLPDLRGHGWTGSLACPRAPERLSSLLALSIRRPGQQPALPDVPAP